ncbi:MAG: hypothetical protein F4045_13675 [Chloroflexi bacterium]|nr:hypothetical protein [Chloroflexota bacterium]MYK36110.1 hypothetical protein [Chloroflexota bacterium]
MVCGPGFSAATFGVAHFNTNGWPITTHDIKDATDSYYRPCSDSPVPHLSNISITRDSRGNYQVTADVARGCVPDITIASTMCLIGEDTPCSLNPFPVVKDNKVKFSIDGGSHTRFRFFLMPADIAYGGNAYVKEYLLPNHNPIEAR